MPHFFGQEDLFSRRKTRKRRSGFARRQMYSPGHQNVCLVGNVSDFRPADRPIRLANVSKTSIGLPLKRVGFRRPSQK